MEYINRRRFLLTAAAAAAGLKAFARSPFAPAPARIILHHDQPGPAIPPNFVGLSYETQQLSDPTFFSPSNSGLIEQFHALAPHGVLRIGGNTSDVGWWKPTPYSKQPPLPSNVVLQTPPGEKSPLDLAYAVTPEAVHNLRAFLDATGWTCLYGINLGTNTPALAAEQADFVHKILGHKLEYFQVGNEPDGFGNRFRNRATWNVESYLDDWLAVAEAIRASVPEARFGLPDVAEAVQWCALIAERLSSMPNPPRIAAITHHYYFGGPPSNPRVNIAALLHSDTRVTHMAEMAAAAATRLHTCFRMTEGNTCYRGGKPGVSDVFASSLWAADYLLSLASFGYAGVNLHGGDGKAVADSLGGTLPGELLMANPKAPHPRPFYTPIAKIDGKYVAEPVYYGLKFAQYFAGAQLLKVDFEPGAVNATAYAAKLPTGQTAIAIINKDVSRDLPIDLPGYRLTEVMTAPSLTSTSASLTEFSSFRQISCIPHASAVILYSTRG